MTSVYWDGLAFPDITINALFTPKKQYRDTGALVQKKELSLKEKGINNSHLPDVVFSTSEDLVQKYMLLLCHFGQKKTNSED